MWEIIQNGGPGMWPLLACSLFWLNIEQQRNQPLLDQVLALVLMAIKKCTSFGKIKVYHPQVNLRGSKPGSWLLSSGLYRSGPRAFSRLFSC